MRGVLRSLALGAGVLFVVVACGALKTGGRGGSGGSTGGSGGGSSCAPGSGDGGFDCNPITGLGAPLPTCSATSPCTNVLPTYAGPVTTPSELPRCKTTNAKHPAFDDGAPLQRAGLDGTLRSACSFTPSPALALPLVVFFHGSGGGADDVYDTTLLRQKAAGFDLSGDPQRRGFVLLSIQARNLHWPTASAQEGSKHDIYYRDLASCSTNPDFANADAFIDELVASGKVDPQRIFVSGWSNGARFAQAYAIGRHETPSPGGNRVAAAAVYSGADPFNGVRAGEVPSCQRSPYPRSTVPIFIVSGWCDLMPCDVAQATGLAASLELAPGSTMSTWVADLDAQVGAAVQWLKIKGTGEPVTSCMPASVCGATIATLIHTEWPDGVASTAGGTVDQEPAMLDFLRLHPLP